MGAPAGRAGQALRRRDLRTGRGLAKAREYSDVGGPRCAATPPNRVVFADPDDAAAEETLACVHDRLGHGAENGPWRDFRLTAAMEPRHGENPAVLDPAAPETAAALTASMPLDSVAVRVDGPRAWHEDLVIGLVVTDEGRRHRLSPRDGVLTHRGVPADGAPPRTPAGLALTLTRPRSLGVLSGRGLDGVTVDGGPSLPARLFSYVTEPDKAFPVVTP
ncbi:alkyl sulfatase C-terminal domain-containing protein [Streptomyces sp. NPDC001595]|uniref:alkyl sulfatase C-terminal domain-containing protein n=1 Tax=Streptomyces sp. NPDC001532 TaxID=3154520 RepID=UPI0033268DAE